MIRIVRHNWPNCRVATMLYSREQSKPSTPAGCRQKQKMHKQKNMLQLLKWATLLCIFVCPTDNRQQKFDTRGRCCRSCSDHFSRTNSTEHRTPFLPGIKSQLQEWSAKKKPRPTMLVQAPTTLINNGRARATYIDVS